MVHWESEPTATVTVSGDTVGGRGVATDDVGAGVERARGLGDRAAWHQRDLGWEGLVEEARRLGPDPSLRGLSDERIEEEVCGLAAELAAMTARWLERLCEFVVRGIWADQGARTPAQWLSWKVGLAPSTAREHVRVALRLRELPRVRAVFEEGRLSFSKVRAITRFAVPEIEELALSWADMSTAAQMEQIAADFRTARRAAAPQEDPCDPRYSLRSRRHPDGTMSITIRAPIEECAELYARLERRVEIARAADAAPRDGASAADAACSDGAGGDGEAGGETATEVEAAGDPDACGEPIRAGRSQPAAAMVRELIDLVANSDPEQLTDTSGLDRHTLVLHAPLAELQGDTSEVVAVEDRHGRVRAMDRRVLRRLACEAGIVLAGVADEGTPMDMGRRDRRLSAALRRALHLRDRNCTFPGCGATRHLHAHHVHHWADGGPTDLSNLVLICSHHHRFVHQNGWTIEVRPDAQHRFAPPDGPPVERRPRLQPPEDASPVAAEQLGDLQPSYVDLDHPMDRNTIVAVLDQEIRRLAPDLTTAA
jgi:hypothetical protein